MCVTKAKLVSPCVVSGGGKTWLSPKSCGMSEMMPLCNKVSLALPLVCKLDSVAEKAGFICLHAQLRTHLQFPVSMFTVQ